MRVSLRGVIKWLGTGALVAACGFLPQATRAQQEEPDDAPAAEVAPATTDQAEEPQPDPFAVPQDATPAELLEFIEDLANPTQQFESAREMRTFLRQTATAIGAAADQILESSATNEQLVDAIHWKLESLRIAELMGDREAPQKADELLNRLKDDPRPEIAEAVREIRMLRRLKEWPRLAPEERAEVIQEFTDNVKAGDVTTGQAVMLFRLADLLSDSSDDGLARRMVNELLPLFKESEDSDVQELMPELEGIARRVNLPGNKIELSGELLDGEQLDWDAYRGKVVLVDYWATWCGPCRMEVPNILENYDLYHDKGFEVLGISLDDDRAQAEQYVTDAGVAWPSLFSDNPDATGWQHPMAAKYAIFSIPRAILVDQNGVVVNMNARGPTLGAELRRLLGAPDVDQTAEADQAEPIGEQEADPALSSAPTVP